MSSFALPSFSPECPVNLTKDLSKDQLLSFPAFKTWTSTLQHSLSLQKSPDHAFHSSPYQLRKIDIQSVDFFGGGRIGFIKLKAEVTNDDGESLPGSVFLRGGSVGMMIVLQPDDAPPNSEADKHVILTLQPRIPAGSLSFPELPAGMLDDAGSFSGGAAKEIKEETGLEVSQDELLDMTHLALSARDADVHSSVGEKLQEGVYPSPGGCDEFVPLFLCQKRIKREELEALRGKLTGLRDQKEKITLKLVPLERLWREGARDAKALCALALYDALRREGKIKSTL